MSENTLINYINGEITFEEIVRWLNSRWSGVSEESCDAQDFVLYFLNFLHEDIFANNDGNGNSIQNNTNYNNASKFEVSREKFKKKTTSEELEFDFPNLNTSTPKVVAKNKSDLNMTWPRRHAESNKAQRSLCLGDFVTSKKATQNKQRKRRIKPTFIDGGLDVKTSDVVVQNKENVENSTFLGVTCRNIEESRCLILEDLMEMQRNNLSVETACLNFNKVGKTEIVPSFENCVNTVEISRAVELYVYLIRNNFILNLLSELYFLISLLNFKRFNTEGIEIPNKDGLKTLFESLHNRIYFSLEALSNLTDYLRIFDRATLNLLATNQRLRTFEPTRYETLQNRLRLLIKEKESEKNDAAPDVAALDVRNVNFATETDNRENFVCDASFHAFRKQRDTFYEVLKSWEDRHKNPDWNFSAALSYKIKTLLNLCDDPVNYRQFATLFKSQLLLVSYKGTEELYMQNEEVILQHFPAIDSSKLNKLKLRLLSKSAESIGLDAPPVFPGYQEFFKDFIVCSNGSFLEHLKDVFVTEILSRNEYKFTGYDLGRRENILKTQAVWSVDEKLMELLVLAKFLGFVESLPFRSDFRKMSKKIVQNQIGTRRHFRAALDVDGLLTGAAERRRVSFTIAWLVVYLSMLDYVTLRLPFFENPLRTLFYLYWTCQSGDPRKNCYTRLLTITSLNWLFGLPHFPSEIYYKSPLKKESVVDEEIFTNISEEYFAGILNGTVQTDFPIDKLDLITGSTLYVCCPALQTFRHLLASTTAQQRPVAKHITPLTRIEPEKTKEQIQKQLEDAFLNSQPSTVRKLIEFSSEKITSGCVRYLSIRLAEMKKNLALEYLDKAKADSEIPNMVSKIKTTCSEISGRIVSEKTELAMRGLMPVDELPLTLRKCGDVSARICREKIKMWLDTAVTTSAIEKAVLQEGKKVASRPQHKITSHLPSGGKNVPHTENAVSAVKIVEKLRTLMINIIEGKNVVETNVRLILGDCKNTIENRCDVNNNILSVIQKLTLELFVVLVCFKPDLAEASLAIFRNYWIGFEPNLRDVFGQVVSVRNVHMLSTSRCREKSWKIFARLLTIVNDDGLVASDDFERQCLGVFKQNWTEETLSDICNCYRSLVENLKDRNVTFSQLLLFISGYCLDLNTF